MRAYARKLGEDEEKWGVVGLLHDFDYERWPDPPDHPLKGSEILRQRGYPEDVIYAILSHADYLTDRYPRVRPDRQGAVRLRRAGRPDHGDGAAAAERHHRPDGGQRQEEDEVEGLRPQRQPRGHRARRGRLRRRPDRAHPVRDRRDEDASPPSWAWNAAPRRGPSPTRMSDLETGPATRRFAVLVPKLAWERRSGSSASRPRCGLHWSAALRRSGASRPAFPSRAWERGSR